MLPRESMVRLRHMLDYAHEAVDMVQGKTRDDLYSDRKLNLALVRLLEIIGEAANCIPKEVRNLYSDIPWPEIISLRNRLIHGYDMVDLDILWQIVTRDFIPYRHSAKSPDILNYGQKSLANLGSNPAFHH